MTSTDAATGEADTTTGGVTATSVADRFAAARSVALRVFVGDRLGLVVFLGALAFLALYWRVGIFINDSYTLANALVALADGHLWVREAVFGSGLETPGMGIREGQYYGRNYGQIVFALPFLWALQSLGAVADPGLVLPMGWSLLVVALGRESGRLLDRPRLGASAGALCGLAGFTANVAVARPLAPRLFPVAALQLSSMVAAALAVVTLYRLLTRVHDRRVGLAAAAVTALATPVGFWASIPKRHTLVLAMVLGTCYALYRSRADPPSPSSSPASSSPRSSSAEPLLTPLGFRAAAYALVGLLTWVHGGEAFAVFLALVVVDVPTAPSNDRRSAAVVAGVFLLSMVPFFVTNTLVTGDPLRPPRMIRSFGTVPDTIGGGTGGGTTGEGGVFQSLLAVLPPAVAAPADVLFDRLGILFGQFVTGAQVLVSEPQRFYPVFVRGGDIQAVSRENFSQTIYLTVTEAAPVVAGVAAAGVAAVVGARRSLDRSGESSLVETSFRDRIRATAGGVRSRLGSRDLSATGAADAFLLAAGLTFLLIYYPTLPLHAQLTVRYLLVFYPLAVYAMARQASLRRVLATHWRSGLWTWAGGVLLGSQLFVAAIAAGSLSRGEAIQVHALVGLAAAGVFAALAASSVLTERFDRATAVAGGLTAALGTDFLLLSGLAYFQYGRYALPAAGWIADLLATA